MSVPSFESMSANMKELYESVLRGQLERNIEKTFGFFKPYTAEQQAQYDKRCVEIKNWEETFQKTYDLMAKDNPVLQLHSPDGWSIRVCNGCDYGGYDYGGYDGEAPEWPCRTVMLILTGDADFHFVPPTPMPVSEYVAPTKTVTYKIRGLKD